MEQTLEAICEHLHGELIGDGHIVIRGVNGLELVEDDELTYADSPQRLAEAIASPAAAILISKDLGELRGRSGIRVHNSKLAFALLLELFHPEVVAAPGVHATAVLGKRVQLAGEVSIGAHVVIGDEVLIGRGSASRPDPPARSSSRGAFRRPSRRASTPDATAGTGPASPRPRT